MSEIIVAPDGNYSDGTNLWTQTGGVITAIEECVTLELTGITLAYSSCTAGDTLYYVLTGITTDNLATGDTIYSDDSGTVADDGVYSDASDGNNWTQSGGTITNIESCYLAFDMRITSSVVPTFSSNLGALTVTSLGGDNYKISSAANITTFSCTSNKLAITGTVSFENAVGLITFASTFYGWENITSLNLTNVNFSLIIYCSSMCRNCKNMTSIIFPSDDCTKDVISFSSMFQDCWKLIYVPPMNTNDNAPAGTVGFIAMFRSCHALTCISRLNTYGASSEVITLPIYRLFYDCFVLTKPNATTQTALTNRSSYSGTCP